MLHPPPFLVGIFLNPLRTAPSSSQSFQKIACVQNLLDALTPRALAGLVAK